MCELEGPIMTGPMNQFILVIPEFLFFIVARHFFCQGFPADSKGLFPSALKKFSFFLFSRELQKKKQQSFKKNKLLLDGYSFGFSG
ncbi:MAG: hypothetical protein ACLT3I_03615 [Ruminococcus sp.]